MALTIGDKDNYTHVEFWSMTGKYSMSKANYLKFKGHRFSLIYLIVNNK